MLIPPDPIRVFWLPGCTSCLRTKEFLTRAGVEFASINVQGNAAAQVELRQLGADSVPVVARGDRFTYAQTLGDVVEFLGLEVEPETLLPPEILMEKLDLVLSAAVRLVRQIPAEALSQTFRNRDRPIRALAFHIFRIVEAFLESMADGQELTYESMMREEASEGMGPEDLARYGDWVRVRAREWWESLSDRTATESVPTYFGQHTLHVVLERTVWHPAQHARQLVPLLESLGVAPDRPLSSADLAGLPLPEKVWEDD
jgi:glutaredoxin/uncharacterized damage-inducible protein DinB